jgi:hypothetical protein
VTARFAVARTVDRPRATVEAAVATSAEVGGAMAEIEAMSVGNDAGRALALESRFPLVGLASREEKA